MKNKNGNMLHYFYKITNLINGNYYYGIHSTDNIDDGYMGSGKRLKRAYVKYGVENFKKDIVRFFDSREELSEYESKIVTESLILDRKCYNIALGGETTITSHSVSVIDKNGNKFRCNENDADYINGSYSAITKNMVPVFDLVENTKKNVTVDEYANNKLRYRCFGFCDGNNISVKFKDSDGPYFLIDRRDYDKNIYDRAGTGKLLYKDLSGNTYYTNTTDKRVLCGELVPYTKGTKHSNSSIEKMKLTFSKINHQVGDKNSNFGKCWVYRKGEYEYESKSIKKDELTLYLSNGWNLGRKINKAIDAENKKRIWINNGVVNKKIFERYLAKYLNEGWKNGRIYLSRKRRQSYC